MATPVPSLTDLQTSSGLHKVMREVYGKLDAMAAPRDDKPIIKTEEALPRNPDGTFKQEFIEGIRTQLGLDTIINSGQPKHKWDATADPVPEVNNLTEGYSPGSWWIYITHLPLPDVWLCVESSYSTSAWRKLT